MTRHQSQVTLRSAAIASAIILAFILLLIALAVSRPTRGPCAAAGGLLILVNNVPVCVEKASLKEIKK